MNIGLQIRKHRLLQKRTLQEIADVCGFTKSLLSKIETGKVMPPVSTLMKISRAMGISMSLLLEDGAENATVFTRAPAFSNDRMIKTDKGYFFYAFAGERPRKLMQPFMFCAKKGEIRRHQLSHSGEEYIYMLSGSMKYRVGSVEYLLNPGDSLYFDACENHELHPVTDEVRYLAVFCEAEQP